MWCIPEITPEFIEQMEGLLTLYAKPHNPQEPIICFDEKPKQLLKDTCPIIPAKAGIPVKRDYIYRRNGTRNIFMAVEPKGGWRETTVTLRRTHQDFAREIKRIMELPRYCPARKIHLVCDNLNTHYEKSFIETFGQKESKPILDRLVFHYTPKHASWLNMAEIELSILSRQALGKRIPDDAALKERIAQWRRKRNQASVTIQWKFTRQDARKIFKYDRIQN